MKSIRALLKDRRQSQRGSVLSAVLIITAFIAIIAGALMTELSTNFLLSHDLVVRVNNQATLNSEMELAIDQFQSTPINLGCPQNLPQASVNNLNAAASYMSCAPTVDLDSGPPSTRLAPSAGFTVDGTYASVPQPGGSEYLAGDSAGNFFRYAFGSTAPSWTAAIGGSVTAPPVAMPDGSTVLLPVANPTAQGSPGCGPANACVAVLSYANPAPGCYLPASARVISRPAAGANLPTVSYFGDSSGSLYAYGSCNALVPPVDLSQPVIAGPVVFKGPSSNTIRADELFLLLSNSGSSQLVQTQFSIDKHGVAVFSPTVQLLAWAQGAVGMALNQGTSLPARLAITFASGLVETVQIQPGYVTPLGQSPLPTGIAAAPAWCCGSAPATIAVGGQNGSLYVLDSSATLLGAYPLAGKAIMGSPSADAAGDWFVGADDGNLYEVPAVQPVPTPLTPFATNPYWAIRSSVQVGPCGSWLCAYLGSEALGSANGGAFLVQFDARQVALLACLTNAPPNCSTAKPRLWASLQVGSLQSSKTVHINGWSYY